MTLHLFFSWQVETDTQKQHNKTFIWDCINAAINKIQNKGELKGVFIKAEEGVRDEPGTPDVIGVCEDRIDKCHIFVSDMTIAESYSLLERVAAFFCIEVRKMIRDTYRSTFGAEGEGMAFATLKVSE